MHWIIIWNPDRAVKWRLPPSNQARNKIIPPPTPFDHLLVFFFSKSYDRGWELHRRGDFSGWNYSPIWNSSTIITARFGSLLWRFPAAGVMYIRHKIVGKYITPPARLLTYSVLIDSIKRLNYTVIESISGRFVLEWFFTIRLTW